MFLTNDLFSFFFYITHLKIVTYYYEPKQDSFIKYIYIYIFTIKNTSCDFLILCILFHINNKSVSYTRMCVYRSETCIREQLPKKIIEFYFYNKHVFEYQDKKYLNTIGSPNKRLDCRSRI